MNKQRLILSKWLNVLSIANLPKHLVKTRVAITVAVVYRSIFSLHLTIFCFSFLNMNFVLLQHLDSAYTIDLPRKMLSYYVERLHLHVQYAASSIDDDNDHDQRSSTDPCSHELALQPAHLRHNFLTSCNKLVTQKTKRLLILQLRNSISSAKVSPSLVQAAVQSPSSGDACSTSIQSLDVTTSNAVNDCLNRHLGPTEWFSHGLSSTTAFAGRLSWRSTSRWSAYWTVAAQRNVGKVTFAGDAAARIRRTAQNLASRWRRTLLGL